MPEGPEVQTMVNELNNSLVNGFIKEFFVRKGGESIFERTDAKSFKKELEGKRVAEIKRAGKSVVFELDTGKVLKYRPSMTGRILLHKKESSEPDFVRAGFSVNDEMIVYISDKRKFSRLSLLSEKEVANLYENDVLDVLSGEVTAEEMHKIACATGRNIHTLLLDQNKIVGLGNIYVNEILYEAGIHPLRPANTLTFKEVRRIKKAMDDVLYEALKNRGTSFSDYKTPFGEKGSYQNKLKVFKRTGEKCHRCGCVIERQKINGRSIFICPTEQNEQKNSG